jgi:hypothetical protein
MRPGRSAAVVTQLVTQCPRALAVFNARGFSDVLTQALRPVLVVTAANPRGRAGLGRLG